MKSKSDKRVLIIVSLLMVVIASFSMRYIRFQQSEYAVGKDAYFHIIQAKSLIETGETHAPDSSMTPQLMALSYRISGDWETAQKLLLSVICALITFTAYFAGVEFARLLAIEKDNRFYYALISATYFMASPTITYIAAQYPKQLLGILVYLLFLIPLFRLLAAKKLIEKKNMLALLSLFSLAIAGLFAHRVSGVFAFLAFPFLMSLKLLLIASGIGIVLVILGSIFIPGILSVFEIERFRSLINLKLSFHPLSVFQFEAFNFGWFIEMILLYVIFILLIISLVKRIKSKKFDSRFSVISYFSVLILIGIFPFFRFDKLDMAFRLFIAAIPILVFPGLYLMRKWKIRKLIFFSIPILILLGVFSAFVYQVQSDPNYNEYNSGIKITEAYFHDKELVPEILIVHHGFSFYYTYITGRHTLPFKPEWDYQATNVYRLATGFDEADIAYYSEESRYPLKAGPKYYLFREDNWTRFVSNATENKELSNKIYSWKNPYQTRPLFLQRQQMISN